MQHLQIEGWNGHQDSILASQCLIYWFSIYAKAENMFHVFWPALCKIKAPRLCASVLVDCASTMDGLFKLHMLCQDENSKTKKPPCLLILLSLFCVSQNTQQCFITILFRTCSLDLLWIRGSKPYNSEFCAPSSRKTQQKINKTIALVFLPPTTFFSRQTEKHRSKLWASWKVAMNGDSGSKVGAVLVGVAVKTEW